MSESSTDSNNGSNSDPSEQAPSEKPVLPGESVLLGESALPEKSVLVVVTSAGQINDNYTTGIWFDEFADPFIYFRVQNFLVVVASPEGGQAPIDPRSLEDLDPSEGYGDAEVELANTLKLNDNIKADMFDALFFPGGHGTMFDLPDNPHVQRLVQEFAVAGKPIGAVCHGPAALVDVTIEDEAFVKGKKVTAFSNEEEAAVEMTKQMPFLLEDKLKQQGAERRLVCALLNNPGQLMWTYSKASFRTWFRILSISGLHTKPILLS